MRKRQVGAGSCHWECLNLRYPSFQWTLLLVLMCWVGILFLFCYLALVTPISGSVINLCYPFNDFTIHSVHMRVSVNNLQLFYWQENIKNLQRLPQMFPFSLPQCQHASSVSLSEGLCCLCLYSGKLDFAAFCWLRAEQKYFLEQTVAKTVLEFSVLRMLHRNVECRRLKRWQGLRLCHCISGL